MSGPGSDASIPSGRGRVVEVVGPPGCGKSTVARALSTGRTGVRLISAYTGAANAMAYLASALRIVPAMQARPRGAATARKQLNWMIRLEASPRVRDRGGDALLVFDQGPVYTMARLVGVSGRDEWKPRYERWWKEQIARWATATDLLVFLDAPDADLVGRIRARDKDHAAKRLDDEAAVDAVRASRSHYETVVRELTAAGITVMRIDTSTSEVADAVLKIEAALSSPARGGPHNRARSGGR